MHESKRRLWQCKTSWQFIQEVGLNTDPDTGQKEAVNVSFQFYAEWSHGSVECSTVDDCTYPVHRHP